MNGHRLAGSVKRINVRVRTAAVRHLGRDRIVSRILRCAGIASGEKRDGSCCDAEQLEAV
ncbi:hypothetical protein Areg01_87890 [Actinoplanes regularis]|nr:hypothetical protein Areg01_87890 [Actinoplanes regularis]